MEPAENSVSPTNKNMKTGIELIAQERKEQIEKHGRTIEKDVIENIHYQLSEAAGLLTALEMDDFIGDEESTCPIGWSEVIWSRMYNKPYKERLIIAGAFIAAELDRLHSHGE